MQYLKTENCVICGDKAKYWHGYVMGLDKFALGYGEKEIIAGFCEVHKDCENETEMYGDYDSFKMGKCIPLFKN